MAWFRCIGNGSSPTPDLKYKDISYLKWQITQTRSNTPAGGYMQVAEFYLYLNGEKYEWDSNVSITSNMVGNTGQEVDKIIDGNLNTKYCTQNWGSVQDNECNIVINLGETIRIDGNTTYSFVTGNDESSRDPISWNVYCSDDGINWVLLDERDTAYVPDTRKAETQKFDFEKIAKNFTILKGTTEPDSIYGNDGQIYLKYVDLSSDYTFKEYLEVGVTSGAYINTGVNCTSNAYFEVDFNFTGSHNESRVFGCGTGGGAMFLIQNYQVDYIAIGTNSSGSYQLTDASNRHKYKANNNGIYIDDTLVSSDVHWENALPQRHYNLFAIDWDGTAYYATNTRVYGCKIWNGYSLVRYFVPAERNSDNALGMLDIINGVFYTNDGTGSFTVGSTITPSISITPITNTYAKVNNTWQSLIGTDVRKIMSGQKPNFVSVGTFVTENTANAETEVYCGFKPDYIHVEMEFESGHTYADYYRSNNYVYSWWDLRPIENTRYAILNGEDATAGANGETGITRTMNSGFAYRVHGSNTFNKNCTYYAVKMSDENNINPIVFKTWAKFNGDGFYVPIAGKDSGEIDIIFYEENYVNDKYPFWWGSTTSLRIYNNKFQVGYYGSGNFINVGDYSIGEHTCIIDRYGDNKIIFDNVESTTFTEPSSANIPLFFTKQSQNNLLLDGWVGYIKEFKVYDRSNNLICNLYPALVNNVACMYDTVNNKSYYANGLTVMDEIPSSN